jgi:general transcription factor 3C polypeptide 5 (transcription factor C subunit 1)
LFKSLSAIAAHAETATVRCRVSASKEFPAFMDQLTAGMVQVNKSVHGDGTQSYSVDGTVFQKWRDTQEKSSSGIVNW